MFQSWLLWMSLPWSKLSPEGKSNWQKVLTFLTSNQKWQNSIFFSVSLKLNKNPQCPHHIHSCWQTSSSPSVTPKVLSNKSCNEFAACFPDTIQRIRQTISGSTSGNMVILPVPPYLNRSTTWSTLCRSCISDSF